MSLARAGWGTDRVVGQSVDLNVDPAGHALGRPYLCEVVGVAADVQDVALSVMPEPTLYLPCPPQPCSGASLLVRTQGRVAESQNAILDRVAHVAGTRRRTLARDVGQVVEASLQPSRLYALLFGVSGAAAIALAVAGVYSVVSYEAQIRSRELGIRLALGAQRRRILYEVLGSAGILIACGSIVGVAVATWAARYLAAVLQHVAEVDVALLCASVAGVAMSTLLAAASRAWDVANSDVARVLHQE